MAGVARGHGGDAGGNPPFPNWQPSSGCAASGSKRIRGAAQNLELEKKRDKNGGPLPIDFDIDDQQTYNPVGPYAKYFKSLAGSLVRRVPFYHDSWDSVPASQKAHVWPTIEYYFDISPFIQDRDILDPVRIGVWNGVEGYCAHTYRNAKWNFKKKHFTARGGPEAEQELRALPPPTMDEELWGRHVNAYMRECALHRSTTNKQNRALQPYIATQGRRSFAEIRHDERERDGAYPSLFRSWAGTHMRKGTYVSQIAADQHAQMKQLWDASRSSGNPRTEESIMEEVLGTRTGHRRGRGRIVQGLHSSPDSGGTSLGGGSDDSPFQESGSEPTSLLAVEFQNVAKKFVEREQEMKQKYIDLKKKYEDDQSLLHSHTLKLKQKENEIAELKKVNLECIKKIKVYKNRFLALDERVFILEETAKDLKCGNLENNNKQQKDFAAPDDSSSGLPLSNKKRDSNKKTKPRLPEIIEIDDDDDDDDDADDDQCISTLKRKRDSNEVKKEHNSDDNDLDYKSTLTTNRVLKEIKRECNSDYVDKIPTGTQSRRNLGELHSQQLTSQALYSPHSEVKPNKLVSSFNTSRSSSGQDSDKVDETYKYVLAKLKKEKEIWESEADMLKEFEKNDELSMNAICALYRQRTNVHNQSDISRINQLARLLFDGDSQKNLRKTASELNRFDLHHIRMLAKKYSARIFDIYQKKIDPFFRPRS